jgi:hypothetical protein
MKKQVPFHDAVYSLSAPFTGAPVTLFKTQYRYSGTIWGDSSVALVREVLRSKQIGRVSKLNSKTGSMDLLFERNLTDAYNNPGEPVLTRNSFGRPAIQLTDNGTQI